MQTYGLGIYVAITVQWKFKTIERIDSFQSHADIAILQMIKAIAWECQFRHLLSRAIGSIDALMHFA